MYDPPTLERTLKYVKIEASGEIFALKLDIAVKKTETYWNSCLLVVIPLKKGLKQKRAHMVMQS